MAVAPSWIEAHCVVPDGFKKGQPFVLYDYQLTYLANFYSVRGDAKWLPASPLLAPAFLYRRGLLIGPQKLGKGPHTAAHVCLEGVGPALFAGWAVAGDGYACVDHGCRCGWEYEYDAGEPKGMAWPTPLIQITAYSEEQTDNIYDALRPMIEEGPLADLIPKTGEEFIRLPGGGRVDVVTSSHQSRLGQRVTFVPQDEVGIWTRQNKMVKVAETQYRGLAGMGGRASLTSNAWDPAENSVAQLEFESADRDIYRQFVEPPRSLRFGNKSERRKIFRIVYPADVLTRNGGHIDLDAIEAEAVSLAARDEPQAARFFGNQLVAGAGTAVDPVRWAKLGKPRQVPPGTRIGLGFDGSLSDDATILRGCTADGYSFIVHKQIRPPGRKEWRVNKSLVNQAVARAFTSYQVGRMFCDPPKWWTEIEGWMAEYNLDGEEPVVMFFDTFQDRRMGPAVGRWLAAIGEGTHTHDGDADTTDQVLAAHKRKARTRDPEDDTRTLYVLVKGGDGRKIDAAIADVLAHEAAMTMPQPDEEPTPVFVWTS